MRLFHTPLSFFLLLGLGLLWAGAAYSDRPDVRRARALLIGELGCNSEFGLFVTFQGTADILSQEVTMNLDGRPGIEACLTTVPEEFAAHAMAFGCTTRTATHVPPAGSEDPSDAVSITDFACAGRRAEVVATMAELSSSVLSFDVPSP